MWINKMDLVKVRNIYAFHTPHAEEIVEITKGLTAYTQQMFSNLQSNYSFHSFLLSPRSFLKKVLPLEAWVSLRSFPWPSLLSYSDYSNEYVNTYCIDFQICLLLQDIFDHPVNPERFYTRKNLFLVVVWLSL